MVFHESLGMTDGCESHGMVLWMVTCGRSLKGGVWDTIMRLYLLMTPWQWFVPSRILTAVRYQDVKYQKTSTRTPYNVRPTSLCI